MFVSCSKEIITLNFIRLLFSFIEPKSILLKQKFTSLILSLALILTVSSCYTLEYNVGRGAQTGIEAKGKNHYLIYGLAPLKTTDPGSLANGATDYTVTIQHTFVDGLLNALTFGIYTPTTTKIIR